MRPYMPFMAALVLFGAVACGASSSSGSSTTPHASSSKATAAQKAAALDKATCLKVMAGSYDTKAQATAYVTLLEGQASQEGVDNTLASNMMTLSQILSGHESGVKALTTAKVASAQNTLKTTCAKWTS
jgi:hypothetical protein